MASYEDNALLQLYRSLCGAYAELERIVEIDESRERVNDGKNIKIPFWKKVQYSAVEKSLLGSVALLEDWHSRFDPSWHLITLIADSTIDRRLADDTEGQVDKSISSLKAIRNIIHNAAPVSASMFRGSDFLDSERFLIPGTSATIANTRSVTPSSVIVDTTGFPPDSDAATITTQVADLARLLSVSDPDTLGLLRCAGAAQKQPTPGVDSQFELIFHLPIDTRDPQSLRSLLVQEEPSLDTKFILARSLAKSVLAVHAAGFVHKNIRPETVLVLHDIKSDKLTSYLLGFEQFRHVTAGSRGIGDMVWQRNLYRHPKRQGILPEQIYTMYHDIYSLGVCLLEIGIWESFVSIGGEPTPAPVLDLSEQLLEHNIKRAATSIKHRLVHMAETLLSQRMGITYTSIVTSCLTVLDMDSPSNTFKDDEIDETDDVAVGLQFVEKVLLRLQSISF